MFQLVARTEAKKGTADSAQKNARIPVGMQAVFCDGDAKPFFAEFRNPTETFRLGPGKLFRCIIAIGKIIINAWIPAFAGMTMIIEGLLKEV